MSERIGDPASAGILDNHKCAKSEIQKHPVSSLPERISERTKTGNQYPESRNIANDFYQNGLNTRTLFMKLELSSLGHPPAVGSLFHKESSSFQLVSRNKMMVTIAAQKRRHAGGVPAKYSTLLAYARYPGDLCGKKMNNTNCQDICHIAWGAKFNWEGFLK